jgi:hypothetical protein
MPKLLMDFKAVLSSLDSAGSRSVSWGGLDKGRAAISVLVFVIWAAALVNGGAAFFWLIVVSEDDGSRES